MPQTRIIAGNQAIVCRQFCRRGRVSVVADLAQELDQKLPEGM